MNHKVVVTLPEPQQQILAPVDFQDDNRFGDILVLSSDNSTLVVGAFNEHDAKGSVYVYNWDGQQYVYQALLTASDGFTNTQFGRSIAVNSDGTKIVVGVPDALGKAPDNELVGAVYIYTKVDNTWTEHQKIQLLFGQTGDYFGCDVAMSGDGSTIAIGAYGRVDSSGGVYLYVLKGDAWCMDSNL